MTHEEIVMICAPDISGQLRGKSFPLSDLERRRQRGIGWVPTNAQITTFNSIADSPFGSLGDLLMVPDPKTEVRVDFADGSPGEHFFLGTILYTDGSPWECCLRGRLSDALDALRGETRLELKSAFELEFQFREETPGYGPGFGLAGLRKQRRFGQTYLTALKQAGVEPDSFLKEWGDRQYEVTMHPQLGIEAADHALLMKELARATGDRLGEPITFTPIRDVNGPGNGVHIHMSLVDETGKPAAYDSERPGGLSIVAGQFAAGILKHLPDIMALVAPSLISYARLTPHRWSAAYNNLGFRDREAALRICPLAELPGMDPAGQFNVEFRACDSAASPHLQLAALVFAGLDGIRNGMEPPTPTEEDLSLLSAGELTQRGLVRLPESLLEALERLEASKAVRSWFGDLFLDVYLKHKRGELAFLEGKPVEEACRLYEQVY
ncbi:MAG: glutamine synthetase [Desulfuromonadales bacterium]|nr:glutamine synthetase [Desulfuromonadales bacterium]NIS40418.1 glutamine synthetase [Desulfuromonadales bacterium]